MATGLRVVSVVTGGRLLLVAGALTPTKEGLHVRLAVSHQTWANIGATEPLLFVPLDRALRDAQPVAEVLAGVIVGLRFHDARKMELKEDTIKIKITTLEQNDPLFCVYKREKI
jgi:hypothetical protein